MTITYQQAKRIRKTGWLDLMSDQLMYEKKLGTAVKKTVSLKTRGMMMGIGEKFDPLNIARLLTFGSSIGPALLGHLTGRNANDIQYFSKRFKPIHEKRTAERITKLQGTGGLDAGSNQVLHKIYKLLNNSYQNDIQRLELAKNREEEHDLEEQRQHKELLEALKGKPTAIKIGVVDDAKQKGWFDKLMELFQSIGPLFTGVRLLIQKALGKVIGWTLKRIGGVAKSLIKLFSGMGGGLFNMIRALGAGVMGILRSPAFMAVIAMAAGAVGIKTFLDSLWKKTSDMEIINAELIDEYRMLENLKNKNAPQEKIDAQENNIAKLEQRKSDLQLEIYQRQKSDYKTPLDKIIDNLESTLNSFSNPFGDLDVDNIFSNIESITPDIKIKDDFSDIDITGGGDLGSLFTPTPQKLTQSQMDVLDAPKFATGQGVEGGLQRLTTNKATNITPVATPAATVETPSMENADTKLQSKVSVSVPKVENNVTNMKQGSDGVPLRRPIPSVRNNEEWYNRVLEQNTRLPN